ncbi:MAG: amidase [Alphaproteobacteria bacterium]|nr:amidase [Alphaproteobacteria bacterium]
MVDWAFRTASELTAALRRREVGCVEVLDWQLARVAQHNPRLNAVIVLDRDGARARAEAADRALGRGDLWGPLHGLPMTIKESIDVAGLPTTSGAPALRHNRPAVDAVAVARLKAAGAIIFGKSNTPLYTGDMQTYNQLYGTTNNPWDVTRGPGGSSGGAAAAVAAGLTPLELGSDIGGSIRNPAHYCGIYGHKPSYGTVPFRGHVPPAPGAEAPLDIAVLGPLARSSEDLALAMGVLAGQGVWPAAPAPSAGRRRLADFHIAAWLDDGDFPIDASVLAVLRRAVEGLRQAGASVHETARPGFTLAQAHEVYYALLAAALGAGLSERSIANFRRRLPTLSPTDQGYEARFMRGVSLSHRDWLALNERRHGLQRHWARFFERYDALLCPVMPTAAFRHDHNPDVYARRAVVNGRPVPYLDQVVWAGLVGIAELPSTVVPVGLTAEGLPVGLQVVGAFRQDGTCIDLAGRIGRLMGGCRRPPGY